MPLVAASAKIKHVFVLMMENRSYDHLLGYAHLTSLAPGGKQVIQAEGLSGTESNPDPMGGIIPVNAGALDTLGSDPKHEFQDVRNQVCGVSQNYDDPTMDGFVASNGPVAMGCFAQGRLPVLAGLAASYAVCDHWFSSLPGPTWPNRLFAHAATSGGLCCSPSNATAAWKTTLGHYAFQNGNVFQALDKVKKAWRIYHQGIPQTLTLDGMGRKYLVGDEFRDFSKFSSDLRQDYDVSYTFIEPHYGGLLETVFTEGDSQHPNGNIQDGEALIRQVYQAIRQSPVWENSLLLVTYDEHGGLYDHVKPPATVAPGDKALYAGENGSGLSFDFKTLGVRVPAVVVSPWIARNTVDQTLYDHSSISKTLHGIFGSKLLTQRDQAAKSLEQLLTLGQPRLDPKDAPWVLPPSPSQATGQESFPAAMDEPMEGLNQLLLGLGARVKALLDKTDSLNSKGNPGAAVPAAVEEELAAIRTKGQAATYLNTVHHRVLARRK